MSKPGEMHPDIIKLHRQLSFLLYDENVTNEFREYKNPEAMKGLIIKDARPYLTPLVSKLLSDKKDVAESYRITTTSITSAHYLASRDPLIGKEQIDAKIKEASENISNFSRLANSYLKGIDKLAGGRRRTRRRKSRKHRR